MPVVANFHLCPAQEAVTEGMEKEIIIAEYDAQDNKGFLLVLGGPGRTILLLVYVV